MTMRLRAKIGLAVAAVVGVLGLAAAAAPYLVDVEQFKPALVKAVKDATGRELVIEGPMKLSMFPRPQISARQVRFANAAGSIGAQMVDVSWVGASPSWPALMRGDFEIGRLTLARPKIVLETDAQGRPNWEFAPGAAAAQPAGAPSTGLHLAIGRLRIVDGTVSYTDPQTGKTLKAEKVDLTASVQSFQGPLAMKGSATVNDVPLALEFSMGAPLKGGHDVVLKLKVDSGTLDFSGRASSIGPDAEVGGVLSVATGKLTDFIAAVLRAVGEAQPTFDASVVGQFTFDGGVEYSPRRLALNDFKMSAGGDTATGTLALTPGMVPTLTGRLSLPKLNLEKWLAMLEQPRLLAPRPAATKRPPGAPEPAATPAFNVNLALEAAEVVYRKGTIRDVSLGFDVHKGALAVSRVRAILPGGMVLSATSAVTGGPAQPVASVGDGADRLQAVRSRRLCADGARHRDHGSPPGGPRDPAGGRAGETGNGAGFRPESEGGAANLSRRAAKGRRGRHRGAGQPAQAEHPEDRRSPGGEGRSARLGGRLRHGAALRSRLQRDHARHRPPARLCRPAEVRERRDRCGHRQRRGRRHDRQAGGPKRRGHHAGRHRQRRRLSGPRLRLPLRLRPLLVAGGGRKPACVGGQRQSAERPGCAVGHRYLQG
ncbi:MAG: AsmA family protein [Alphaproteobacteria bacterium]|nr:AsmA family protein [Alphaproteobacteria bacterium]